jgi:hypothetical protein
MPDTKLTKPAGEHWVCSVLARLDWGPALTRDGLERTDILAVRSTETRRMVEIQVKAANAQHRSANTNWLCLPLAKGLRMPNREANDLYAAKRCGVITSLTFGTDESSLI